ncbi:hypothetical protein ERO13_A09G159300v2 [Gossypium hirsutum]|uniref:Uncharacterized protein isoform X1 n=2 Tax=Gossypium hirsutum TaxID=3635 RepID=A0A1U8HUQ6_GOSHI|nr:uncharacterized protein LOC107889719 isoform X1 [Gossypium hirsutum]KAG4184224.1 hypothetical protein ERO13_A09G159300v2 [Gossypium hirsutum]
MEMETFGQRRPKISSFSSDQSLVDLLPSTAPASSRGNRQLQKQRKFPKLVSDSSSCSSDTTEEDQLTFELTCRSSKQSTGTPMKKLLAKEMTKENESRRRAPSVIARLMGLDGLPPQQPDHKQQKRNENSHEKVQRGSTSYSWQSSRKSSKDEQEFKDVFEVLDALKMEGASFSSQGPVKSKLSDTEVAFIRHKFMEAKRLSTDEKLQDSEEFNDTLEVLNSNTDLLLNYFQQPNSLFTKHLHDLRVPPQSHCGRVTAMKSSHTLNNENCCFAQRIGRETQTKLHCKSPMGHQEDCLNHSYGRYTAHNPSKSPVVQLEEKNGPTIVPTRIVVLKPNLGKSQNSSRTASSPCSSHHFPSKCTRHSEILGIQNKEAEIWGKNKVHQDTGFSRYNSRDSREMAKEITGQMKNSFNNSPVTISTSRFRGHAGDESSCDVSGSESANDSDVTTVSYRDNISWNKRRHRRSSSRSSESSVSREAKKRLSERWKLTHKSQEVHMVSRGSTLGEMLATSDREVIPGNSSGPVGVERCNEIGNHVRPAVLNEPLGISSRDGWKDGCLGNLSRSRSLPASSTNFGSPGVSIRPESLRRDKNVNPKESFMWDRNKAVKGNFNQREAPLPSNQRSRVKKSQLLGRSCSSSKEYSDTSPDSNVIPYQVKQNIEGDKQSENNVSVSGASSSAMDSSSVLENAADVNDQNKPVLSEPSQMELSPPASLNPAIVSTSDLDNLDSQEPSEGPSKQTTPRCPVSELESQANCKEADQPSPVSVIEAPFTDDLSSGSECFESISADLHELRMQLRQLKLESEAYEDGTLLLSSDDDSNEVSVGFAEESGRPKAEENWESVYIVDVLVGSGIDGAELDTFLAAWHSPECPVNPLVFQQLEKKYCSLNYWSRAERRLMFDRINSKILEMYQEYNDQPPWMISGKKIIPTWNIRELEDSLHKSLVSQNKIRQMDVGEMVLAGECLWLDLRWDIDTIGRGIERLLVDELVAEVLAG